MNTRELEKYARQLRSKVQRHTQDQPISVLIGGLVLVYFVPAILAMMKIR